MRLHRKVALDYAADGIRVNAVIPAVTDTPLIAEMMADEETRSHLTFESCCGV